MVECEERLIQQFKAKLVAGLPSDDVIDRNFLITLAHLIRWKRHTIFPLFTEDDAHLFEQKRWKSLSPQRIWELLRKDSEYLAYYSIDIKSRLTLRFAFHMMDNQHFPPFEDHFRTCRICRLDASVFLKEYVPGVLTGECAKKLTTSELLMLKLSDLEECPKYFAGCENGRLSEALNLARIFHTSSLAPSVP